jgi:hypothetical protein
MYDKANQEARNIFAQCKFLIRNFEYEEEVFVFLSNLTIRLLNELSESAKNLDKDYYSKKFYSFATGVRNIKKNLMYRWKTRGKRLLR